MDFKPLIIYFCTFPTMMENHYYSKKNKVHHSKIRINKDNNKKIIDKSQTIHNQNIKESPSDDIFSFLNFYYENNNNVLINVKLYNGFLDDLNLFKESQKKVYEIENHYQIKDKETSHVFNLISNKSHNNNNLFHSSLDEGNYKNIPWLLDKVMVNNEKIEYNNNKIFRYNDKVSIVFKKNINQKIFFRIYYFHQGKIEIEEICDLETHCFNINNSFNNFDQLYVYNNNSDGGKYLIKYTGKNNKKFDFYKNNENNPININSLDFLVQSNDLQHNNFFTLWNNSKYFLMVQPLDTNGNFNKSIIINKKNHHWMLQYKNFGYQSKKLLIIMDLNCLDQIKNYNNSIINGVFPMGYFDKINLLIINGFKKFVNLVKNKILGLILLSIIIKLLILLLIYFYRRRFHIFEDENFFNTKNRITFIIPQFLEFMPIMMLNIINRNSSIFIAEPFLWIKDFSWGDQVNYGWRFFSINPLAMITASCFVIFKTENNQEINFNHKNFFIGDIFQILFINFILRYFLNPVNAFYIIIQVIINYLVNVYIKSKPNVFRKK